MKIERFEDIIAWQKAKELESYRAMKKGNTAPIFIGQQSKDFIKTYFSEAS